MPLLRALGALNVQARVKIPKATQTNVLTTCRRRCCICFGLNSDAEIKRGQIAHLDHDPNNNKIDNLAFLCLDHHSEFDSRSRQTKGFLDDEVKEYRLKLIEYLDLPVKTTPGEITADLLQELIMVCHSWKNDYISLYPGHFKDVQPSDKPRDVWEMFQIEVNHTYSDEEWSRYAPLFNPGIRDLVVRFDRLASVWSEYLDDDVKHMLLKTPSQLQNQARFYVVTRLPEVREGADILFTNDFKGTLRLLGDLSRELDRRRA